MIVAALALASCTHPSSSSEFARWNSAAASAMERAGAHGLALAVIDQGRPVFVRSYGVRNAAGDPLTPDTVMYGASLTKSVFAYTVVQLAEEGKVDLDQTIAEMFPKPLPDYGNLDAYGHWGDLAGDPRWRAITPRMILTHSSGFANFWFVEPNEKLRIHFEPGSRFAYSGEGIILLQFALEKGLGLDVGSEMQRRVFDHFGMAKTGMTWRAGWSDNLADGWTEEGIIEPHDERSKVRAAGSMDTSIADMAEFAAGLVSGEGLSARSRDQMVNGQLPITTRAQFPTLADEAPPDQRWPGLSAGLGVVTFEGPQGRGYFKGGHNESTANMMVCLQRGERCVLILSNDVRAEPQIPRLVETILGPTGLPWGWEYGPPR